MMFPTHLILILYTLLLSPLFTQNVFHPPYDKLSTGIMVTTVFLTGYGVVYFGMRHQQYKQGYWK
jgi:hypothetical protein